MLTVLKADADWFCEERNVVSGEPKRTKVEFLIFAQDARTGTLATFAVALVDGELRVVSGKLGRGEERAWQRLSG